MTNFGLAKPIRRREAGADDELKARIDGALAALDDLLEDKGQATSRRARDGAGAEDSSSAAKRA